MKETFKITFLESNSKDLIHIKDCGALDDVPQKVTFDDIKKELIFLYFSDENEISTFSNKYVNISFSKKSGRIYKIDLSDHIINSLVNEDEVIWHSFKQKALKEKKRRHNRHANNLFNNYLKKHFKKLQGLTYKQVSNNNSHYSYSLVNENLLLGTQILKDTMFQFFSKN